jgi:glycosyltransferase involved in cell wall biosynthesis
MPWSALGWKRLESYFAHMTTTVTAVVPAYNSASFIGDAIQSVLAQTRPVAELIVVDDGSNDNTAAIAASYPGVHVIRRPNGGPGAARNAGVAAASGDWIALLDADDTWGSNKTEVQLRDTIDDDVAVIHASRYNYVDFDSLWHRQARVAPSGALVRREALLRVGGFDEDRRLIGVEDLDLWLRLSLAGYRFARAGVGLFTWRAAVGGHLSQNEMKMALAELLTADKIGVMASIPSSEIARLKDHIRLEYARNLIGSDDPESALMLLHDCGHKVPTLWLQIAALPHLRRLARTDLLRLLRRIPF